MSATITPTDLRYIVAAREAGALLKIEKHRIKSAEGTIFVGCSDGDCFSDLYAHHCKVCTTPRHHPLLLNGGALLLSHHSPVHGAKKDATVLLRHIKAARNIKGIHTVVLYVHAPCGVAHKMKLDFLEVFRLLIEAKLRLRAQKGFGSINMSCFLHTDNGKMRTYFVDRKVATEFLDRKSVV